MPFPVTSRPAVALGAALLSCAACAAARAETVPFTAALSGAAEVPPNATEGKGTAAATFDTQTKVLTYDVQYAGLSGPATAAHFHGPAEPGANAGVVLPFPAAASPIRGTATLTDAQASDLMAGKWYANVHTAANPAGEIRGQMTRGK